MSAEVAIVPSDELLDLAGPMPDRFKITFYAAPGKTTVTPAPRTLTWAELVEVTSRHRRRAVKGGEAFSGAKLKPGTTRANENVEEVSILLLDDDHSSVAEYTEIRDGLIERGLGFFAFTTFSSNDIELRVRFGLPLAKPLPPNRYSDVWEAVDAHLFAGRLDSNARAISQPHFLPEAPPDAIVFAEHFDGGALDWEKLPPAPIRLEPATGSASAGQDVGVSRDVAMFTIDGAPSGQQRRMACRAARSFLAAGKTEDETVELVWRGLEASPIGKPSDPWTYDYARKIVEDLARRKPTPLKALPELRVGPTLDFERGNGFAPPSAAPIESAPASDVPTGIDSSGTSHLIPGERKHLFRTAREIAEGTAEAPTWRVPGYVADGVVTELDGKLKSSGKTTLLMAMVGSVAEGRPFLGQPTIQTGAIILTEQNTTSFRAALARAGLLECDDVLVLFWSDARDLPWPVVVQMAAEAARQRGIKLLIVDTLPQFAGIAGDGENSSGAALEAMRPLQEVAAEGLAVVISRHERKGGGEVGESARGSSAFSGAVDIVLSLRRPDGQQRETVRILQALSRFDETPSELMIELIDGEYVALGTAEAVKAADVRRGLLERLPASEGDAIDIKAVYELFSGARIGRTTIHDALNEHVEAQAVRRLGSGKKGDPYKYWHPSGIHPSGAPVVPEESISAPTEYFEQEV